MEAETSPPRHAKKNQEKVPKRIHKSEREKKKREHLNDLFLALADALELNEQNNGKAFILNETARVVKDMLDQIESLKRDNAALLSESQYVMVEKNELLEENSALQVRIGELKSIFEERMVNSSLDLNVAPSESQEAHATSPYLSRESLELPVRDTSLHHPPPVLNPIFVIPVCAGLQADQAKPASNVSKPHPRYPTPADSWPVQVLEKRREGGREVQSSHMEHDLHFVA